MHNRTLSHPAPSFPADMPGVFPGTRTVCLSVTRSTNDEARRPEFRHGDIVLAEEQTAGRGQRGNSWESLPGRNLTFSIVLEPAFLPAECQFYLSETICLGIADTLESAGIEARIKWPNDIYIGDRKAAGILIENDLCGTTLRRSIAGIGLNVNQESFSPGLPNPVSLHAAAGRTFDRSALLADLCAKVRARYRMLEEGDVATLERDYHARLYRLDTPAWYAAPDGRRFRGTIRRVEPAGELVVEHGDGSLKSYLFKEIEFIVG